MKKLIALMIIMTMLSGVVGCAGLIRKPGEDPWTRSDMVVMALGLGLLTLDWNQTRRHAQDHRFDEQNPILGDEPSRGTVDIYFPVSGIIAALLAYKLKRPYRELAQWGLIGIEGAAVINNHENGWD